MNFLQQKIDGWDSKHLRVEVDLIMIFKESLELETITNTFFFKLNPNFSNEKFQTIEKIY